MDILSWRILSSSRCFTALLPDSQVDAALAVANSGVQPGSVVADSSFVNAVKDLVEKSRVFMNFMDHFADVSSSLHFCEIVSSA